MKQEQEKVAMPLGVNVDLEQLVKKETVICDMCGHINPAGSAICEQCSNYLDKKLFSKF